MFSRKNASFPLPPSSFIASFLLPASQSPFDSWFSITAHNNSTDGDTVFSLMMHKSNNGDGFRPEDGEREEAFVIFGSIR